MAFLAAIIGAVLGLVVGHDMAGFLFGGVLGYLLMEAIGLKSRVTNLERELEARAADVPAPPAAPLVRREPPQPATPQTSPPAVVPRPAAPAPLPSPTPTATGDVADQLVRHVREFFTGGNTLVRVGVVVLFFGVAFLLKYAAEHARLPIELRLASVALAAIVLLGVGAHLRRTREAYGLTLEGGAIGVLYLVVFAAFRLYALLPASFAFALLIAICALSVVLALAQNSLALAAFGAAGGFLAPVLASTGQGSHVMLFSYYAVLNVGILAIAWFKAWRPLNLVGFGFTFVIGSAWGYRYYQPEFFATTEPFLILFFLLYVAVTLLFARRQSPNLGDPVDGTLVFGVPIVGFLLQVGLARSFEFGVAWSAFVLGAFYLGLAAVTLRRGGTRLLAEAFVALGMIFATLTMPLAVDGHWTAAAWAVEGAGVLWVGLRQSRVLARAFGLAVQLGAGAFFALESGPAAGVAVLNNLYVGAVLVSVAGVVSAFLLHRYRERAAPIERELSVVLLVWGMLWWYGGSWNEIRLHVDSAYRVAAWLALTAGTGLALDFIGQRAGWTALRYAAALNSVHLVIAFASSAASLVHPFAHLGFIAWPLALAVHYRVLRRHETAGLDALRPVRHAAAVWLLVPLLGWEIHRALSQWLPQSDWSLGALGVLLAGTIAALTAWGDRGWPVTPNRSAYLVLGAAPVVGVALVWLLAAGIAQPGQPAPLPFLPVLNPLDVAALFVLIASLGWIVATRAAAPWPVEPLLIGLGVVAFAWLNAVLFRTLHHFADVPYVLSAMLGSVLAQSAISIVWTGLAFALMVVATRVQLRYLWLIGGGLLAVVVAKLFLVDLSSTGTVARIVSFVGVGALLLVIGYFVPVPPRLKTETLS